MEVKSVRHTDLEPETPETLKKQLGDYGEVDIVRRALLELE